MYICVCLPSGDAQQPLLPIHPIAAPSMPLQACDPYTRLVDGKCVRVSLLVAVPLCHPNSKARPCN